jgi:hypothetical protein
LSFQLLSTFVLLQAARKRMKGIIKTNTLFM